MLLYTRRAPPKPPKRRSRAGCVHCKEKKKKCTEERPACQRCVERGLECHYEPIQPRKRRRTASPADPSRPDARSASASPNIGPSSRVQSLRHGSNATSPIPTPAASSSSLNVAGSWDMHSSYDDSASQYTSDFRSECSISPDIAEGFPQQFHRPSSVPVESMDMLVGDYQDHRPRSHLGTPDLMPQQFRRSSHSGTPDMMSVPYRRPSDTGEAEIITSIPLVPSHHVEQSDMVTSAPVPTRSPFGQTHNTMIHTPQPQYAHPHSHNAMGPIPTIRSQHVDTMGYLDPPTVSSTAFYQSADAFVQPLDSTMPLTSAPFYGTTGASVPPPHTSEQNMNNMAWWPNMDQADQNYYMQERQ